MHIKRAIQAQIEARLFKKKAIIVYGPRRIGKTTLAQDLLKKYPKSSQYLNCDEPDIRAALSNKTSTELKHLIGNKKFVVIDEAQRVENIGLTIKLLVDNYPKVQILATGSSSFDLSNKISEPLTGRVFEFTIYPFSITELKQKYSAIELQRLLPAFLRFGSYPEIINTSAIQAPEIITDIAKNYLYKDILEFEKLKNPDLLLKLLQALALQVSNEVSYNELARLLEINKITVEKYIHLLEKSFIIFRLNPFSRNPRREINSMRKIYFYDLGIRNSLIKNFNELNIRPDLGALWENFCIIEKMKSNAINNRLINTYFWRNYKGNEIDYLEEYSGKLAGYEFKWGKNKIKIPKEFTELNPNATLKLINKSNFFDFV